MSAKKAKKVAEATSKQKKPPIGLIVAVVVLSVLLFASAVCLAIFIPRALQNNSCGANMTKNSDGDCISNDQDAHSCPEGTSWGYGGNPNGMTDAEIEAHSSCLMDNMAYKPIIYLYPTHETEVSVRVSNPQNFTAQYPTYGDGWRVIAQPNGNLHDTKTGRELYSLYYETKNIVSATVESDGFVVGGDETAEFLENVLPRLGLNAHESEEFIIFCLPILQQHPYNYIRFETLDEMNANQKLTISPRPNTLIRVMMSYKPLQTADELGGIREQNIVTPTRAGFVVVEWGGTEIGGKVVK